MRSMLIITLILSIFVDVYCKVRLWVDCDPGVDDAMALILASYDPNAELLGVSTVFGNTSVQKSTRNALRVLSSIGKNNIPVFSGAGKAINAHTVKTDVHGQEGLFAVEKLIENFKASSEGDLYDFMKIHVGDQKFTLVVLGGQTNIAKLFTEHPEILPQIEQVVIMGGTTQMGNQTPNAEFNIYLDPEAAKIVLDLSAKHDIKYVMIGLDITHKTLVTEEFKEKIKQINTNFSDWCAEVLYDFQQAYKVEEFVLSPLHDPVALYYALHPEIYNVRYLYIDIETESEICRGRTSVDKLNVFDKQPNGWYGYDVDQEPFWNALYFSILEASKHSKIENQEL